MIQKNGTIKDLKFSNLFYLTLTKSSHDLNSLVRVQETTFIMDYDLKTTVFN